MTDRITCVACDSDHLENSAIWQTSNIYQGYHLSRPEAAEQLSALLPVGVYNIFRCRSCGLESAHPLIAPDESWYTVLYNNLNLYPGTRWEFSFVPNQIPSHSSVADIGCGNGHFVQRLMESGRQVKGFDFSSNAIKAGQAAGLPLAVLDIRDTTKLPTEKYNTLVSFHVLEHLQSPSDLFKTARLIGQENATLWVSVPSDRRPARVYQESDYLDLPPHHMTRWTAEALRHIGAKNGWQLKHLVYEPISLKDRVWNATIRTGLYRKLTAWHTGSAWLERLIRLMLGPVMLASEILQKQQVSGFSMLAKFERRG